MRLVFDQGAGTVGSTGWANWGARRPPSVLSHLSSLLRQESGLLLSDRAQTCLILLSGWLRAVAMLLLGSEFAAGRDSGEIAPIACQLPHWEVCKLKLLVTGLVCVGIGMLVLVAGR
ncbi:hypothetical protein [Streptomyces mirabilis]|uniref:hypothetical protein n=1 Tax=Streptomyces mirabilis TaxID=68239 RepID=UPI0036A5076E